MLAVFMTFRGANQPQQQTQNAIKARTQTGTAQNK